MQAEELPASKEDPESSPDMCEFLPIHESAENWEAECSTILSPLVLTANLFLFLRSEVVGDVEGLSDFLWRLALDHIGDSLATNIEEWFDVKVVGSENNLEEHLLIDLHEPLLPLLDIGSLLAGVGVVISGSRGIVLVMLAPFNDLLKNGLIDIGNRNGLGHGSLSEILHHVFDEHGALGNLAINNDLSAIIADEGDSVRIGSHCG